jgi:restriction system protein
MRPVLDYAAEGEVSISDTIDLLAKQFLLTDEERAELLPSKKQTRFANRVNWAKSYLKQAGLVKITGRGLYEITDAGRSVLEMHPGPIDRNFLERFDDFLEFQSRTNFKSESKELPKVTSDTPDETLRDAYEKITSNFAIDLIDRVRSGTPEFFENLIVQLLLAMGYGGTSEDAGQALGQTGDGGVDGVIDQDPLGVDQIYIQAKRYAEGNNIGAGAIRDFFGALNIKKAQKGIFVTSSNFSNSAKDTAAALGTRIVLIDGLQLARLMIRYNIGCRDEDVLHIKKIDEDFFE